MEHIVFFIFILLLQKCSNNQIYPMPTANHQNIPNFMNPNSRVHMRTTELPITTQKNNEKGPEVPVLRNSFVMNKNIMQFTQAPFKIPYAVRTLRPKETKKKTRNIIPHLSPTNYTQLKKINFYKKTKVPADESKREEDRRREELKRFAEQSNVVDAKKRLQMLERELEMKRELGRADLKSAKKEFVIPQRETKVNQQLPTRDVIAKIKTLKIQPPLFAKDSMRGSNVQGDKSDSSSEELNSDDDKLDLNYELDEDRELKVKW